MRNSQGPWFYQASHLLTSWEQRMMSKSLKKHQAVCREYFFFKKSQIILPKYVSGVWGGEWSHETGVVEGNESSHMVTS